MRLIVGLLLVSAALLKSAQFLTEQVPTLTSPFGNWVFPLEVGVELGIGLLVLAGVCWRRLRWLALIVFAAFAGYSVYLAVDGASSCGCFGPVEVHPWWTFLLDVTVVLGLSCAIVNSHIHPVRSWHIGRWIPRHAVVTMIVGVAVVSIALLVRLAGIRTATASDSHVTAENVEVMEPKYWIGKSLPIADAIDLDMTQGRWIVVLHRHDCPDCWEAVPLYEQLAAEGEAHGYNVGVVEVPPYGVFRKAQVGKCKYGALSDKREWIVQTPVEIRLHDGIVTSVSTEHPALDSTSE